MADGGHLRRHGHGVSSSCCVRLPEGLGFDRTPPHSPAHAGQACRPWTYSLDPSLRYTFWSGLLGGLFLSLSYFGTDQSQVQRYIGGAALREGRLGLMFNAAASRSRCSSASCCSARWSSSSTSSSPHPVFFNRAEWQHSGATGPDGADLPRAGGKARRAPRREAGPRSPPGKPPAPAADPAALRRLARAELVAAAPPDCRARRGPKTRSTPPPTRAPRPRTRTTSSSVSSSPSSPTASSACSSP